MLSKIFSGVTKSIGEALGNVLDVAKGLGRMGHYLVSKNDEFGSPMQETKTKAHPPAMPKTSLEERVVQRSMDPDAKINLSTNSDLKSKVEASFDELDKSLKDIESFIGKNDLQQNPKIDTGVSKETLADLDDILKGFEDFDLPKNPPKTSE